MGDDRSDYHLVMHLNLLRRDLNRLCFNFISIFAHFLDSIINNTKIVPMYVEQLPAISVPEVRQPDRQHRIDGRAAKEPLDYLLQM